MRLSSLGDIVHVWPVAAALRTSDPTAKIAWLTRVRYRELLTMHPCLNEILTLNERPAWDVWGQLWDVFTMISRIRRQRYDVLLDLHAVWLSHWIGWFSGARRKLGLDKRNDRGFRLFQYRRLPKGRKLHRVRLYLEPLEFLGIGSVEPAFPFQIPNSAQRRIDGFFQEHKVTTADVVVTIHPGTAVAIKRWPADRFQELADQLARRSGVKIILVRGAADPALRPASATVIYAPVLSHPELAELLRRSDLVVGNDSGPLQLAAALGRPTVAIFGPSDSQVTGPWGAQHRVIQADVPCRPCYGNFKIYFYCKRRTNACIQNITLEQVCQAIDSRLTEIRLQKNRII